MTLTRGEQNRLDRSLRRSAAGSAPSTQIWMKSPRACTRLARSEEMRELGLLQTPQPEHQLPAECIATGHVTCSIQCLNGRYNTSVLNQKFATSRLVFREHCNDRSARWKQGCHRRIWSI